MSNKILSKVVYRYPNEQQKTIEDANNWRYSVEYINTTIWQGTGEATNIYGEKLYFIWEPVTQRQDNIIPVDVFSLAPRIGQNWALNIPPYDSPNSSYSNLTTSSGQNLVYWRHPRINSGWDFSIREYLYQEKPSISYWQPVNGTPVYTLHIYRDNTEVFSRTEEFYPVQVFLIEKKCPDNTCSVDCGTHICCYGSDKIATYYYTK